METQRNCINNSSPKMLKMTFEAHREKERERRSLGVLLLRQIKRLRFMPRGCEHFFFEMERQ